VRADQDKIIEAIRALVEGTKTWQDIESELPLFESQQEVEVTVR
jgi:glycyl-tRNA synthetase